MKRSSQETAKAVKQSEEAALEAYEANERENAAMALELSQVRREVRSTTTTTKLATRPS